MPEKHRLINNNDLLEQLQDNAAMLKTIMKQLTAMTSDPLTTEKQNLEIYKEFLAGIKFVQNEKTKIG